MLFSNLMPLLVSGVILFVTGGVIGWWWRLKRVGERNDAARECAQEIIREARRIAHRIQEEGKISVGTYRKEAEARLEKLHLDGITESNRIRDELNKKIEELHRERGFLHEKEKSLARREHALQKQQNHVTKVEKECEDLRSRLTRKLEQIGGLLQQEARQELRQTLEEEVRKENLKLARRLEEETRQRAQKEAKNILGSALERHAAEIVAERAITVVKLPNEEMKGRIIGREGRNIRALETAAGVSILIDETPEVLLISGFDPLRREIAARALQKLIEDGKIHPLRIEEEVSRAQEEVEKLFVALGEQAAFNCKIQDFSREIVRGLGSLKFKQTDSQNLYEHSLEVADLAGLMAAELGIDVRTAQRAGLLHDIGRAIEGEKERHHAVVGAEFARNQGESGEVVEAIAHHDDHKESESLLVQLIRAANQLSKRRPGARKYQTDELIRRLEDLESYPSAIDGVDKAFVLKTGGLLKVFIETSVEEGIQREMIAKDVEAALNRQLSEELRLEVHFTKSAAESLHLPSATAEEIAQPEAAN